MTDKNGSEAITAHVEFAGRLTRWMERAGVPDGATQADLGVGFADILHAASEAQRVLDQVVALDPTSPVGAEQALGHLGYLHTLFLGEIKSHLEDLDKAWPVLEGRLAAAAGLADDDPARPPAGEDTNA